MSEKHLTWEELYAFIDGELEAEKRSRVEAHLAACPLCGREAELARNLVSSLKDGEETLAMPNLTAKVMARLPRKEKISWFELGWAIPVAAALALIVNRLLPVVERALISGSDQAISASNNLTASIQRQVSAIPTMPTLPTVTVPTDPVFWLVLSGGMAALSLAGFLLWFVPRNRSII